MAHVSEADLTAFVVAALSKAGLAADPAQRAASVFIEADLRGIHSHGLDGLPPRLDAIEKRLLNPNAEPTVVRDLGSCVLLEGHQGFGPVLCSYAAERAAAVAAEHGIAFVSLRNSSHWACPAYYSRAMALRGAVGIAMTNTNPGMPLHGSTEKSVTNAPYTVAAPISGQEPIVLDMSFQSISWSGMKFEAEAGRRLPGAWGYDREGRETDDPAAIIESGRVRPIGDYKGSGFAFMQEILTGVVGAGMISAQIGRMTAAGEPAHYAQTFIAIRSDLFSSAEDYDRQIHELYDTGKSATRVAGVGEITLPGDRSNATLAERRRDGIPFDAIRRPVERLAARYGLPLPHSS